MAYCKELGTNVNSIFSPNPPLIKTLTNGALLEIFNFGKSQKYENKEILATIGKITSLPELNFEATLSKIYRVINNDKVKRGTQRETYRKQSFTFPVSTATSQEPPKADTNITISRIPAEQEKLDERRGKVKSLTERNKQLKRKLERREQAIEKEHKKIQKLDSFIDQSIELKKLKSQKSKTEGLLEKAKIRCKKQFFSLTDSNRKLKMLQNKAEGYELKIKTLEKERNNIETEKKQLKEMGEKLKKSVQELEISNDYLQGLLQDEGELNLYNAEANKFSNELVECALNLTDLKVATKNVGPVIKEVATLCGKVPNRLPSRQTVDTFVDRKVSLSQKQLSSVLKSQKDTTLYTDETRKFGHTFQSYIISDKENNSYLLGLREMQNKSAKCTLDTLKEILDDISNLCKRQEDNKSFSGGYDILCNIRNTMSDRASTEKLFNSLLQEYRCTILPQVIDNFERLTSEEKDKCGQMNNFFCGLHLLVGMADVSEETIRKFEVSYLEEKVIGSAQKPELKRYHRSESGTLRLLRTCSKAFAIGEDEKNGVYLPWKTYLGQHDKKNHILRFKHNRFNMVFMVGGAVLYHNESIVEFLENVHGTKNDLLKAVLLDCKEILYLAGAKTLGLISKFITAPLWRLIETPGHILDMNQHFDTLTKFLEKAGKNVQLAADFLTGKKTPFDTLYDATDEVMTKLVTPDETLDGIVVPLLQNIFMAINVLLTKMIPEHLPGGKFWDASPEVKEQAESSRKHNKAPEFIFGQLDHLMSYRPNASVLANEAYLIYSYNKTCNWLKGLPQEEKDELLQSAIKEGKELRKTFKGRLHEIEAKQVEAQKKRKEELQRQERERIVKEENMTNDICYYGLWQSETQIEEGISRLEGKEKVIVEALQAQLKFRKNVLKQKHENKAVFNFSYKLPNGKYKKLTKDELKNNLKELVSRAASVTTAEQQSGDIPLLVDKRIEHTFSDQTYKGYVIGVVPGFHRWYNVKYDNDDAIYVYNLLEDYKKGDLRIIVEK